MQLQQLLRSLVLCVSVSPLSWIISQPQLISQAQLTPASAENIALSDVPYVVTPDEVVIEMLKLADVTKDDVVYDLGSGDGRLVVKAAQEFGARGVGVEINPRLIQKSQENAQSAGVSERVQFVQQDLFEVDISSATVVTLYLLRRVNLQLRPKLLDELQPGTRIISHQFDMAEWKPERVLNVRHGSRMHRLYYWLIPAKVSGTWRWNMQTNTGEQPYQLELSQQLQQVSGTLKMGERSIPITEGKLVGKQLSFNVTQNLQGREVKMQFSGRVDNNTVKGGVEMLGTEGAKILSWEAARE